MNNALSHLKAINERLIRERARLAQAEANNNEGEIAFRAAQVSGAEREIEGEIAFLAKRGVEVPAHMMPSDDNMSDDELLAALS